MKTIEEHNRERQRAGDANLRRTGVECPKCQEELLEDSLGTQLTSLPPQIQVKCSRCLWRGYINA